MFPINLFILPSRSTENQFSSSMRTWPRGRARGGTFDLWPLGWRVSTNFYASMCEQTLQCSGVLHLLGCLLQSTFFLSSSQRSSANLSSRERCGDPTGSSQWTLCGHESTGKTVWIGTYGTLEFPEADLWMWWSASHQKRHVVFWVWTKESGLRPFLVWKPVSLPK